MAVYGMQIQPEDGGKAVDITVGARIPTYKGFYNPPMTSSGTTSQTISIDQGASLFVLPSTVIDIFFVSTEANPIVNCLQNLTVNGSSVSSTTRGTYRDPTGRASYLRYSAFQVMGSDNTVSKYGVYLADSSNYMEINDTSTIGGCVFRQQVTVNGSWQIPANVADRDRCIVFANWSHPSFSVTYNDPAKTINVWAENGSPATLTMFICVFANGEAPQPPQYGLALYNASGYCTFSSKKAPMLLRGSATLSSNIGQPASTSIAISRPMLPLGVWGIYVVATSNYEVFYAGLTINSSTISTGGAGRYTSIPNRFGGLSSIVAQVNLPILNTDDYF